VALAAVLLVGAGLILRSFSALLAIDPGFDRQSVTTIAVQLPAGKYSAQEVRHAWYRRLIPALHAVPGVEAVGAAAIVPLTGNNWTIPFIRADRPPPPGERAPDIGWQNASGGYFEALKIPVRAGRVFRPEDAAGPPVVVISESVARRFFDAGEPVVGQRVLLQKAEAEIIGVVGDIRRASLTDDPRADMYLPFERQNGVGMTWFIRSRGGQTVSGEALRAAFLELEPHARIQPAMTLDQVASESTGSTQLVMWLLSVFGVVALALAAVGVYGVLAYAVRQRMREFGTRVALGASGASVAWLVLRQGATIVAIGLIIGLAIASWATRALHAMMYAVTPFDPATLASAAALLAAVGFVGCYLPARRASRVDPLRTLAD
jgi:putative ABC transport system permease protein